MPASREALSAVACPRPVCWPTELPGSNIASDNPVKAGLMLMLVQFPTELPTGRCGERSDEAIPTRRHAAARDCFAVLAMTDCAIGDLA